MDVYPLIFQPIFKPKVWGGRRLERLLSKPLPAGAKIGESWEIADLEDDQSIVANGPAAGRGLGELVREWGEALIGRAALFEGRFPLLIKFLDACDTLSVQVHPDAAMAGRLGGRVRVKNEAWYVLDAEPDGFIYRGLKPGTDSDALRRAIEDQSVETLLNRIAVRPGHCYFLPSGTIHALGAGVAVAEVQTPSDVTYRVYDYNRIDDSTGRPRELHVEEALECVALSDGTTPDEHPQHVASVWTTVTSLVRCDSFVIERVRMVEGVEQEFAYDEMVIWIVLEGGGAIRHHGPGGDVAFRAGDSLIIPAALRGGRVSTRAKSMWLEVTIPIRSSLADFERPDRASLSEPGRGERYVQINPPGKNR